MNRIRVLVVEDSTTVRSRLCEVLNGDSAFEVVGEAEDGRQAIELCRQLRPDVVTLDLVLPVMSGLAATEYIMAHCPTPILIVSGATNRGDLFKTYDALSAGAVDVLEKPNGDDTDEQWQRSFASAVKMVSRIKVITHPRARLGALGQRLPAHSEFSPLREERLQVLAIGASTGGPAALIEVLRTIPPAFPIPIAVVLHLSELFGGAFSDWLDQQIEHPVSYARHGETLSGACGRVILAPPGRHLVLRGERLFLTDEDARHSCRPSIDVFFQSLARECGASCAAALLTGMGRDGAAGLLSIRRAGGRTVAQDEATSVVYGMPREAALLGAAERISPLSEIGPWLAGLGQSSKWSGQ